MAVITFATDNLGGAFNVDNQYKVMVTIAIILKRTWEAWCDAIFNNIPVNIARIATLVDNDLIMELSRNLQLTIDCLTLHPYH